MKKPLSALAAGTLVLGIAEFMIMGILPNVANGLGISNATAGHLISAYAIGVCFGAPMLVLARKFALKNILLALVGIMVLGNFCSAIAPNYHFMMLARFVSGLPHGAYFGVASIVALKLAPKGKTALAISIMISGMTIANLFGVPLGTTISTLLSWRAAFFLTSMFGLAALFLVFRLIPQVGGIEDTGFKGQFKFLKSIMPWLLIACTLLGNGSIFCWYSYINPLLTEVSGFPEKSISLLMFLAGVGMVCGNMLSGKLSDKFTPAKVATAVQGIIAISLMLIFFFAQYPILSATLMFICTFCLFALGSPQQLLLLQYSKGGEMLGAACVQIAFNLGNAIGAYAGGLPIEMGLPYNYTALVGFPAASLGFILFFIFTIRSKKFSFQ